MTNPPTMLSEQVAAQAARLTNGPGMRQGPGTNMSRSNAAGDVMLQQVMEVRMVRVTGVSSTLVPPFVYPVSVMSRLYQDSGSVMPVSVTAVLWSPIPISNNSYVWAVNNAGHYEFITTLGTSA